MTCFSLPSGYLNLAHKEIDLKILGDYNLTELKCIIHLIPHVFLNENLVNSFQLQAYMYIVERKVQMLRFMKIKNG